MDKVFRFARFEADRERYQLRHSGRNIKLERLPLELLFLLLENSGKLVQREEIVTKLWRDHSFLDTERSINTAVRKIRMALEDDANHPQFVETVVGKGYRFMAPLIPADGHDNQPRETRPRLEARNRRAANGHEIRLRDFSVETMGGATTVTCDVVVGNVPLGRLPLAEIELPGNVSLPLNLADSLRLKLHGVRVNLTAEAAHALQAFSLSILQSRSQTPAAEIMPPERTAGTPAGR